jgi:hypothetical protein
MVRKRKGEKGGSEGERVKILAKVRGFLRVTLAKVGGKRAPNELGVFGLGMFG